MASPLNILVLEDNPLDTELMLRTLRRAGIEPTWQRVDNEEDYLAHLHANLDLILSDFQMPQFNGLRALELLKKEGLDIPFILISGTIGEDTAVEAMRQGATDYLLKDRLTRLASAVEQALEQSRLRKERRADAETLRLREIALNAVSQGVVIADEHRRIIYANSGFTVLTGYEEQEILGRSCGMLQGPGTDRSTVLSIRAALAAEQPFEGTILNFRRDGRPFWNDLTIAPFRSREDQSLRFIGVQRDVTERIEAGEELAASETLLRQFVKHAPAAIAMLDTQMRYIQTSERWIQDYHLADRDIIGKSHYDVFPEAPPRWKEIHRRVLSGTVERCEEDAFLRADGTTDWLQWEARPWHKAGGEIGGLIFFTQVITERKAAETEVRFNEQRYRSLVEATAAIVWDTPASGEFEVDQPRWTAFTGQSFEEHRGRGWLNAIHPDDRVKTARIWAAAVASRHPYAVEHRLRAADRTYHDMMVRAVPILDDDGAIRQWIGVHMDITDRKRTEARLRRLVDSNAQGVFFWKANGVITVANDEFLEITGYDRDDLEAGRIDWLAMTPPEFAERDGRALDDLRTTGICSLYEKALVRKDGSRVPILLGAATFEDNPDDGVCFVLDITDRIQAEQKVRLTSERLQLAAQVTGMGIWEYDCVSDLVTWDDQMFALYGQSRDGSDSVADRWAASLHADDRARTEEELSASLRDETKPFDTAFRIVRKNDGATRYIRAIARLLRDESGKPWRMIGTNLDVTEEWERERALSDALAQEIEHSQRARAGDRAKGEFLAVMSHEIRTPLNGILGFSELLSHSPDLPTNLRDYVETITSSGEALLRILNDVLDYSRLDAGHVRIENKIFAPQDLLGDIRTLLSPHALEKNLVLGVSVGKNVPKYLIGDGGRLRQILLNLAGNALKFTDRGWVTLGLRRMPGKASYEFFVRDTGSGIAPEQVEHLFQPFTQADSSISRRYGGTGLGLSISRRLAELLNGSLTVRSEPGCGAEFLLAVTLDDAGPSTDLLRESPPPLTVDFSARYPLRILVVEDDKINLKLMLALIRRLGYEPLAAINGREAVEIQRREPLDCLLMDLQMPGMDGIEATEKIRAAERSNAPVAPVFISALTANIVPADRQRCFDAGMNSYLNKPVKLADLAAVFIEASSYLEAQAADRSTADKTAVV